MDAIARIRDFALKPAGGGGSEPVRYGVASSAPSFDSPGRPNEQEMCRVVRPYRFVVRVDADALREGKAAIKLFRFDNRSCPVGTFASFRDLMDWLTQESLSGAG